MRNLRISVISTVIAIGLSTGGCGKHEELTSPAPAPTPVSLFDIGKLASEHGIPIRGDYAPVEQVKSNPFHVAVLATWCPYSLKFLEEASKDPEIAADYLLVVYENEFEAKVKSEKKEGNISEEQATALLQAPENRGRFVYDADKALSFGLPIYVVRAEALQDVVTGYPSRLKCDYHGCKKIDLALSEWKAIVRSQPELVDEMKKALPEKYRLAVERDPELLVGELARQLSTQRSSK